MRVKILIPVGLAVAAFVLGGAEASAGHCGKRAAASACYSYAPEPACYSYTPAPTYTCAPAPAPAKRGCMLGKMFGGHKRAAAECPTAPPQRYASPAYSAPQAAPSIGGTGMAMGLGVAPSIGSTGMAMGIGMMPPMTSPMMTQPTFQPGGGFPTSQQFPSPQR